jgi:hypothetical protein
MTLSSTSKSVHWGDGLTGQEDNIDDEPYVANDAIYPTHSDMASFQSQATPWQSGPPAGPYGNFVSPQYHTRPLSASVSPLYNACATTDPTSVTAYTSSSGRLAQLSNTETSTPFEAAVIQILTNLDARMGAHEQMSGQLAASIMQLQNNGVRTSQQIHALSHPSTGHLLTYQAPPQQGRSPSRTRRGRGGRGRGGREN